MSPNLQGVASAATGFAAARSAGLGARAASGLAFATGLGIRTACAWRHEIRRDVTNSVDSVMVASWLGESPAITGGWAIEPDFGRLVIQETLQIPAPGVVVECGSGTTTLLIARALRERREGRLFSIESDHGYADRTWRSVRQAGLADWVEPIVAPIEPQHFGARTVPWFSLPAVDASLPTETKVDLLIVDGPPMLSPWSRWPAVEALWPRLRDGASVLLDDGRRAGERRTAFRWRRDHPELELAWYDTVKGTWRLVKRVNAPARRGAPAGVLAARALLTPYPSGDGRWPKQR
jgi:predicted O-methyltransferase YrrM